VGVLAVASPALFPAFAIPIWGIVIGVWVIGSGRVSRSAAETPQRSA
jgi:hypothetical protein